MINVTNTVPDKDIKGHETVIADVGEESRRAGRTPIPIIIDKEQKAIEKRWVELLAEKKDIEGELTKYSKTAMAAAQLQTRKENYGASRDTSIVAWITKKTEMDKIRQSLVSKKIALEKEMSLLKPRLSLLNRRNDWDEKHAHLELLRSIVYELRDIKELLKRR